MTEAVLQILLLLAYLAIGLISVTFPIYAICVTYLRQEKWETEKESKQRTKKLKDKIRELTSELSGEPEDSNRFEEINRQIKESKKEQKFLKLRTYFLTAHGAVLRPVVFLILALIFACFGVYGFYEQDMGWAISFAISSALVIIIAIVNLYQTISVIEHAALRSAHTVEFDVCYKSRQKSETIKRGEETKLGIGIGSLEEDVQNFQARIYIPPEVELKNVSKPAHATLQSKKSDFPYHNMVILRIDYLHTDIYQSVTLRVLAKETGKHKIPIRIHAKGIYEYKTELFLNVVKK